MQTITLTITTPEAEVFSADVQQVSLPTTSGEITVLPHHEPLITLLGQGDVVATDPDGELVPFALTGGCARITGNTVAVLADFAEHVAMLTDEMIQKAHREAAEAMEKSDLLTKDEQELHVRQLQHAVNQERIRGKWKNKKYRKL